MVTKPQDSKTIRRAVERLHGVTARLVEVVTVIERFRSQTAWEGRVHVFAIQGHAQATVCYAWAAPRWQAGLERVFAVLGVPPVNGPGDAVRAAIVAEHRDSVAR